MFRSLLALSLCAVSLGELAAQPAVRQLRVVTYNMHHGLGADQELNLDRIADVLRNLRPDLVALQEVDVRTRRSIREDQAHSLGRKLGMNPAFGKAISYDDGEYGNAILSRFPIDELQVRSLDTIEGHEARSVAIVRVRLEGNGPEIYFLSTHLDHASEGVRLDQAHALGKIAIRLPRAPTILAGDMNAAPDSKTVRRLRSLWTDAGPETGGFTYPSAKPASRIDYVFYRNAPGWRVAEQSVVEDLVASDHRPVLTVFEVSANADSR